MSGPSSRCEGKEVKPPIGPRRYRCELQWPRGKGWQAKAWAYAGHALGLGETQREVNVNVKDAKGRTIAHVIVRVPR